jgi:uncharacterized caspase-like protein
MIGVRAIRYAHDRRTQPRFWLRFAAMVLRDWPHVFSWRELAEFYKAQPLLGTVLEADAFQLDESRVLAPDLARVVTPKANRYLAVAAACAKPPRPSPTKSRQARSMARRASTSAR